MVTFPNMVHYVNCKYCNTIRYRTGTVHFLITTSVINFSILGHKKILATDHGSSLVSNPDQISANLKK